MRVREVLDTTKAATAQTMAALQQDVTSVYARELAARLSARGVTMLQATGSDASRLDAYSGSAAAAILLERMLTARHRAALRVGGTANPLRSIASPAFFRWLDTVPRATIDSVAAMVTDTLRARRLGSPGERGDSALRRVAIRHPLSALLNSEVRRTLDHGPLPRSGAQHTINMTGTGDVQTAGPSFRVVIDVADWDASLATNSPGQSGDPRSPFYGNLFEPWVAGRYFPLAYSECAVARQTVETTRLVPAVGATRR
jgi:penicillin G amidase